MQKTKHKSTPFSFSFHATAIKHSEALTDSIWMDKLKSDGKKINANGFNGWEHERRIFKKPSLGLKFWTTEDIMLWEKKVGVCL